MDQMVLLVRFAVCFAVISASRFAETKIIDRELAKCESAPKLKIYAIQPQLGKYISVPEAAVNY